MAIEKSIDDVVTFTPGPWTACKDGDCPCGFIWDASEEIHVASAHGREDVGQSWYGADVAVSEDEQKANALLIAATPELFVRLSDLVAIIEKAGLLNLSNGVELGATSWYAKASERLELAKAALAKAEGREAVSQ